MRPYEERFIKQTINRYNKLISESESGQYSIVKSKEESLSGYLYEEEKNKNLDIIKLFNDDKLIMELTPKEIEGYFEIIKNAKGKIGIVGLGLGYLAEELANKKEVTEVVVYEISSSVIELYKRNFKNRRKIKILNEDAYKAERQKFDFFFVDIYNEKLVEECANDYKIFNEIHDIEEYSFWGMEHFLLSCRYEEIVWVFIPEIWMDMTKDLARILDESGYMESYKPLEPKHVSNILEKFKVILNEGEEI
ncbi:Ribosomal RNA adenine dimethylase [Clostridium sp. DSM 8431]|uniref:rRNA adenine N-6-methyltransferase family protein n=1 Tax=Clostridium sp. DSM 8431 TaxID=1761781 RepID=UPI0008EE0604|nr:rRNA adenine N-6-methyltransferase family protein [Clostridium sp. DSM 8431]SFU81898.1 Ribosomal RNA adenine dimethylase [Clostridium sp. DSM 8431]